jgi:hypothetical protein
LRASTFGLAALTLAFGVPASASLIVESAPLLGASSVVLDTATGLYWLKPDQTLGRSYSAVQAEEGFGNYAGFTLATAAQLGTLFSDGGVPNTTNTPLPSYYSADLAFITVFGQTGSETRLGDGVDYDEQELEEIYLNSSGTLPQYPYEGFVIDSTYSGPYESCSGGTQCGEASVGQFFSDTTTPGWSPVPSPQPRTLPPRLNRPLSSSAEPGCCSLGSALARGLDSPAAALDGPAHYNLGITSVA